MAHQAYPSRYVPGRQTNYLLSITPDVHTRYPRPVPWYQIRRTVAAKRQHRPAGWHHLLCCARNPNFQLLKILSLFWCFRGTFRENTKPLRGLYTQPLGVLAEGVKNSKTVPVFGFFRGFLCFLGWFSVYFRFRFNFSWKSRKWGKLIFRNSKFLNFGLMSSVESRGY